MCVVCGSIPVYQHTLAAGVLSALVFRYADRSENVELPFRCLLLTVACCRLILSRFSPDTIRSLVPVPALLVLLILLVRISRHRKGGEKYMLGVDPEDDVRENIMSYNEEGAGRSSVASHCCLVCGLSSSIGRVLWSM